MLTHSYYDEDPRVRREAESLALAGYGVDVLSLRRPADPETSRIDGVRVYRLNVQRHQGAGLLRYLWEYLQFAVRALLFLLQLDRTRRYRAVIAHSPPDFLIMAALPVRLRGAALLLDLHEAMPEFFRVRFAQKSLGARLVINVVEAAERVSLAVAHEILTVNEHLADRLRRRGVSSSRLTVVMNSAGERFDPKRVAMRSFAADGTIRLIYAGALTPIYEVDVAIRAMDLLRARRPDLELHLSLYGRGDSETALRNLVRELTLESRVTFHGRVSVESMPDVIAGADIGIAPTSRTRFTEMSLSTKVFEYVAMRKPAIASRLSMVTRVFGAQSIVLYEPGSASSLAEAVVRLADDSDLRTRSVLEASAAAEPHRWDVQADRLSQAVTRGMGRTRRGTAGRLPL